MSDPILQAADQAAERARLRQRLNPITTDRSEAVVQSLTPPIGNLPITNAGTFGDVTKAWLDRHVLFGRYWADGSLADAEKYVRLAGEDPSYDYNQDPFVLSQPPETHDLYRGSRSRAESILIAREHINKVKNERLLALRPGSAILAAFATLPLDPATWLDVVLTKGAASASKLRVLGELSILLRSSRASYLMAKRSRPVLTTAAAYAATALGSEAIVEAGLHQYQPERTMSESMYNAMLAAAFGGVFGGVSGKFSEVRRAKAMREIADTKLVNTVTDDVLKEAERIGAKSEADYATAVKTVLRGRYGDDALEINSAMARLLPRNFSPFIRAARSENLAERILAMSVSGIAAARRKTPDALVAPPLESLRTGVLARANAIKGRWKAALKGTGLTKELQHRYLSDVLREGGEIPPHVARATTEQVQAALKAAAKEIGQFIEDTDGLLKHVGLSEELVNIRRIVDRGYFTRRWHKPQLKDDVRKRALVEGIIKHQKDNGVDFPEEEAIKIVEELSLDRGGQFDLRIATTREGGRSFEQVIDLPSNYEWSHNGITYRTSDFLDNNVDGMIDGLAEGLTPRLLLADRFLTSQHSKLNEAVEKVNELHDRLRRVAEDGELTASSVEEINALRRDIRDAEVRVALATSAREADEALLADYIKSIPHRERAEAKLTSGTKTLDDETIIRDRMDERIKGHDDALDASARRLPRAIEAALQKEADLAVSAHPRTKRIAAAEAAVSGQERKIKDSKRKLAASAKEETSLQKAIDEAEERLVRLRNRLSTEDAAPLLPQENAELVELSLDLGGKINEINTELAALGRRRGRVDKAISSRADLDKIYGGFEGKDRLAEARRELGQIERRTAELQAERTKAQKRLDSVGKKLRKGTHSQMGGPRRMEMVGEELKLGKRVGDLKEKLSAQRLRTADLEMRVLARQENELVNLAKKLKEARANKLKPTEIAAIRRRIRAQVVAGRRAGRAQALYNQAAAKDPKLAKRRAEVRSGLVSFAERDRLGELIGPQRNKVVGIKKSLKETRDQVRGWRKYQAEAAKRARQLGHETLPKSKVAEGLPSNPKKQAEWFDSEMRKVSYALRNARRRAARNAENIKTLLDSVDDPAARSRMNKMILRYKGLPLMSEDPSGFVAKASNILKSYTGMRLLGNIAISSISDVVTGIVLLGGQAWIRGLASVFSRPLDIAFPGRAKNREEIIRAISMFESVAGAGRLEAFAGFSDGMAPVVGQTGWGRAGNGAFNLARRALLIDFWNSRTKTIAAFGAMDDMLSALHSGRINKAHRARWRAYGLNDEMIGRIKKQWETHGSSKGGYWSGSEKWTDAKARAAFSSYLHGIANSAVITPGVYDLPFAFSHPLGSIALQFRSFGFSVVNRVLVGGSSIARSGGLGPAIEFSAVALIGAMGIGYIIAKLKNMLAGRGDEEISPIRMIEEGGVYGTIGDLASGVYGFMTGETRGAPEDTLMPPSADTIRTVGNLYGAAGRMVRGEGATTTDLSNLRRAAPLQNAFWLRLIGDTVVNSALYGAAAEDGRRLEQNIGRYTLSLPDRRDTRPIPIGF